MDEVYKYQESITYSLKQENEKHLELERMYDVDQMISKAKIYSDKLVNIKRNILLVRDRTARLKRKATKILEDKTREDLEVQRCREQKEMLEKHLEPVVNTKGE